MPQDGPDQPVRHQGDAHHQNHAALVPGAPRILALDQRPSFAAAALPISQSASISSTQAITSHPNQPHRAVMVATAAAMAAFTVVTVVHPF